MGINKGDLTYYVKGKVHIVNVVNIQGGIKAIFIKSIRSSNFERK